MGSTQTPSATTASSGLPSLEATEQALRASWTPETSDDPDAWNPDNPAAGQCIATTLVIQGLHGGEIVIADVLDADGTPLKRRGHAWNRLPSGEEIDFTYSQFRTERLGPESVWTPEVDGDPERISLLAARVGQVLGVEIDVDVTH